MGGLQLLCQKDDWISINGQPDMRKREPTGMLAGIVRIGCNDTGTNLATNRRTSGVLDKSGDWDTITATLNAGVAELADALRSGRSESILMRVQIPPSAQSPTSALGTFLNQKPLDSSLHSR